MVVEMDDSAWQDRTIDCPVLVTERLVMRPPHEDDIPYIAELANNRRVAEMLARMPSPYRIEDASAFVSMCALRTGGGRAYALTLAESGAFIGCAGLDAKGGELELGYWIGQPYWNCGYATEAAHALVDLAFRATEIDRLLVSCRVDNPASRRIIHKCGFRYSGQGIMDSLAAGRVPVERYQMDRSTWVSLRSWGA